ncbi:hypothetical protein pdam_00021691 [Pocillopora damicornis]|uniref:Uncharacterized protein n=1 Tax=Pocillopora damicornis TaxID=46731 RepID=A0A3M6TDH6_POCDA|nr:hypothetical protein pdam_00021691 [Pocillopora damicornis]
MSESDGRPGGYSNLQEAETKPFTEESDRPNENCKEPVKAKRVPFLKRILAWRKYIILIMTPILLMPLPIAVRGTHARSIMCSFPFSLLPYTSSISTYPQGRRVGSCKKRQ